MHTTYPGHCWPNDEQIWLLKAALKPPKEALQAWETWASSMNIDDIDPFSYQMMPKIYKNLASINQEFSHHGRLKGIYKRNWMDQQLKLNHLIQTFKTWPSSHEHRFLLMKGAAMCGAYYLDWGVRMMGDIDILILPQAMPALIQHLHQHDFEARDPFSITNDREASAHTVRHAITFQQKHTSDPLMIDVHISPLVEIKHPTHDPYWFQHSQAITCHGVTLYALNPTDLLFQTCIHGAQYSEVPLLRFIMDAITILDHHAMHIDWDRILTLARTHQLVFPLKYAFRYLHEIFDAPIPSTILKKLEALPISRQDETHFHYKNKKVGRLFHIFIQLWCQSKREHMPFLLFLKHFWGLNSIRNVPTLMLKKTFLFLRRT